MKIQLLSDVHLEFYNDGTTIHNWLLKADMLVLAGDIHVGTKNVTKVLRDAADEYENVIFVPGNHEYYDKKTEIGEFRSLDVPNNVHCLDNSTVLINGIAFIGATLWSDLGRDVSPEQHQRTIARVHTWPDFYRIKDNSIEKHLERYDFSKQYIENTIKDWPKHVVITHFMPHPKCTHPRYQMDSYTRDANWYFTASSIEPKCPWMFGHTHDEYFSDNLYCSPVGYPNENPGYVPSVIELPPMQ